MTWEHFVAEIPCVFRTGHRVAIGRYYVRSAVAAIILGISIPQQSNIITAFQSGWYVPQGASVDDMLLVIAAISVLLVLVLFVVILSAGSTKWRERITAKRDKYATDTSAPP
jgi:hypothetical protein